MCTPVYANLKPSKDQLSPCTKRTNDRMVPSNQGSSSSQDDTDPILAAKRKQSRLSSTKYRLKNKAAAASQTGTAPSSRKATIKIEETPHENTRNVASSLSIPLAGYSVEVLPLRKHDETFYSSSRNSAPAELPQCAGTIMTSLSTATPILSSPPPRGYSVPDYTTQSQHPMAESQDSSSDCELGPQLWRGASTIHEHDARPALVNHCAQEADNELDENCCLGQEGSGDESSAAAVSILRAGPLDIDVGLDTEPELGGLAKRSSARDGSPLNETGTKTADCIQSPIPPRFQQRMDLEDIGSYPPLSSSSKEIEQNTLQDLRDLWDERIRLLSQCATASETTTVLTKEVEKNNRLKSATFWASELIDDEDLNIDSTNDCDISDYHGQHRDTRTRLTREHHALVARLEREKAVYAGLQRALLMEVEVTPKAGDDDGGGGGKLSREPDGESEQETEDEEDAIEFQPKELQQQEKVASGHAVQSRIIDLLTTRLRVGDQVAAMKGVLGEMRRMKLERAAPKGRAYAPSITLGKRHRERDDEAGTSKGRMRTLSPSPSCSSSSHYATASASRQDLHTTRLDLERCVYQIADIYHETDRDDLLTDLLQVALDELRTERVEAAQAREEADAQKQAEVHSEVSEELSQITQQTISLDTQVGEVTDTLTDMVLHVDDLEEMVAQQKKRTDGARVEQLKEQMRAHAALQTKNAAAISALFADLDECIMPASPSSPGMLSPTSSATPVYPALQDITASLAPSMADAARSLLESTRSEISSILRESRSAMLQTLDVRVAKTLDAVEELATGSLSNSSMPPPEMHALVQAEARPLVNESHDASGGMVPPTAPTDTPIPMLHAISPHILADSVSPTSRSPLVPLVPDPQPAVSSLVFRARSVESLRYTPPPDDITPVDLLDDLGVDDVIGYRASTHLSLVAKESNVAPIDPQAGYDILPDMEIPLPKADTSVALDRPSPPVPTQERPEHHDQELENATASQQQLDCSFLTYPSMQGIPVRVQPRDSNLRVCRPFAFVRTIPATSLNSESNNLVDVRDCRKGYRSGKIHKFPLEALCYIPPTKAQQRVVCLAPGPGVDPTQRYYVIKFNIDAQAGGQATCVVRKDPKVPNAELILFPAHMLAQVTTPMVTRPSLPVVSVPISSHAGAAPAVAAEGTKKLSIKIQPRIRVHFDHPPPMWLKDPVFNGFRVQLREQDGNGSILELITVDISASTVEVQPLLSPALRRSLPLADVRHVLVCAPFQTVVAIAGDLKGTIMKVGIYSKEECTLYSPLKRRENWAIHRERRYKTADLAVILAPRK